MSVNSVFSALNIFPLQPMKFVQGIEKSQLLDAIGKNCEYMSTDMLLSLVNDFVGAFSDWSRRQTLQSADKLYRVCNTMANSTVAVQQHLSGLRCAFVYKMVRLSVSLVQLPAIAAWNAAAMCSRQGNVDYQEVLIQVSFYLRQAYNHMKQFPIPEFSAVDTRFALNFIGGIYLETQLIKAISQQTQITYASKTVNLAQKLEAYNKLVRDKTTDYVRVSQISEMETLSICRRSSVHVDESRTSDIGCSVARSQGPLQPADLGVSDQAEQLQPYAINFSNVSRPLQVEELLELVNYLDDYYNNLVQLGQETRLFNDLRIVSADRAIFFHCFERFVLAFNGILHKRASYALSIFEKIFQEYDRNQINVHEFYLFFAQVAAQLPETECPFNDITQKLKDIADQFSQVAEHTVMIYPKGLTNLVQSVYFTAIDQYLDLRKRVLAISKNIREQLAETKRQIDSGIGLPDAMQPIKNLQTSAFRALVQQAIAAEKIITFTQEQRPQTQEQALKFQRACVLIGELKAQQTNKYDDLFKVQEELQNQKVLSDRKSRVSKLREKLTALKPEALSAVEELDFLFEPELKSPVEFLQFCIQQGVHFKVSASVEDNVKIFQEELRQIEKKKVTVLLTHNQDVSTLRAAAFQLCKNFLRTQLDVEQDELAQPAQEVAHLIALAEEVISIAVAIPDPAGNQQIDDKSPMPARMSQLKNIEDLQVSSDT